MKTILLLGGYGNTGKATVKALLSYFKQSPLNEKSSESIKLLIAGRHECRATAFIQELSTDNVLPAGVTLEGRSVDASNIDSLKKTIQEDDVNLMVVVSSTSKYVATVVQAVLEERNVDYFDVQYSQSKTAYLTSLQRDDKLNNQLWITDGGFHPGLPGAMIRFLCDQQKQNNEGPASIETINVYSWISCDWNSLQATMSDETMEEFAFEMMNFNGKVYREGEWKDLGMGAYTNPIQVDFGEPYGTKACVPMYLEELKELPSQYPSLQNFGFYIAGFHWVIDWLIMPFMLVILTVFPFAKRSMGKLLFKSLQTFCQPPFKTILKTESSTGIDLILEHDDAYALTGIAAAAVIIQYLEGNFQGKKGLHYQAGIVDPNRLFQDLRTMGVEVRSLRKLKEN